MNFSRWIDRWGRFSDGRDSDRAAVVDEDIHGPHIDGIVSFVRVKVVRRSVGRLPHRYRLLIPVLYRPGRLARADGKAQENIPSYQCLFLKSRAVVLGVGRSCKSFRRFPVFWSL
jgi:hypothetical protein